MLYKLGVSSGLVIWKICSPVFCASDFILFFLDMHMMVAKPEQWVKPMAVAGANQYTFHIEATDNAGALIKDIRENGMKVRGLELIEFSNSSFQLMV